MSMIIMGHSSVVGQEEGGGGRSLGGGGDVQQASLSTFSNLVRLFITSNLPKFCN